MTLRSRHTPGDSLLILCFFGLGATLRRTRLPGMMVKVRGGNCPGASPSPAEMLNEIEISEHKPVQLMLPGEIPGNPRKKRRLQLEDCTGEEWSVINNALMQCPEEAALMLQRYSEENNASVHYVPFARIPWALLEPMYAAASSGEDRDPLPAFIAKNPFRPKTELLNKAVEGGRME